MMMIMCKLSVNFVTRENWLIMLPCHLVKFISNKTNTFVTNITHINYYNNIIRKKHKTKIVEEQW